MKEVLAVSIICFWLFLPVPLIMMGVSNYPTLDTSYYGSIQQPAMSATAQLGTIPALTQIYFQTLIMDIPGAPWWVRLIVNALQLISGLVIILLVFSK